jgi:glutamate dehydrogenase (NAD(P)+)
MQTIEEKVRRNTTMVLEAAREHRILPRQAAMEMAEQRIRRAMSFRRYSLISTAPDYT